MTISDQAVFWHGKVLSIGDLLDGVRSCERERLVKVLRVVASKFRDGKVGEVRYFSSWQRALGAAGLSAPAESGS